MRFLPAPNSAGNPEPSETPVPFGPRKRSHCPHAAEDRTRSNTMRMPHHDTCLPAARTKWPNPKSRVRIAVWPPLVRGVPPWVRRVVKSTYGARAGRRSGKREIAQVHGSQFVSLLTGAVRPCRTSSAVPVEGRAVSREEIFRGIAPSYLGRDFADFTKLVRGVNTQRLMPDPVLDGAQQK